MQKTKGADAALVSVCSTLRSRRPLARGDVLRTEPGRPRHRPVRHHWAGYARVTPKSYRVRWRGVGQRHTTGEAREQWSEKAGGEGGGKDVDQGKPREACRSLDTAPGHCVAGTAQGAPEGVSKDGRTIHRATSPRDASAPGG